MPVDRRNFLKSTVAGIAAIPAMRPTVSATTLAMAPSEEDPLGVRDEFPITKTHISPAPRPVGRRRPAFWPAT